MGKNKLAKFAEMETFPNVFQMSSQLLRDGQSFCFKGKWRESYFRNNNPIVLELGCGKGEYSIGLGKLFPEKNFIGVDIKGARLWSGAKQAYQEGMTNVAFLRTNIEMINHFFEKNEVDEIWLTFPDPQMKKTSKRLTATNFMLIYQQFLKPQGLIHLKTDSNFLFTYTVEMVKLNNYPVLFSTIDLYGAVMDDKILDIRTYYEQQWLERGITIKYVKFQLVFQENLCEPEVLIEHDSYRSFGRSKRRHLQN